MAGCGHEKGREATGMFETVEVSVDDDAQIALSGTFGHGRRSFHWLEPQQARELALVLLAAAQDAEAVAAGEELEWDQ